MYFLMMGAARSEETKLQTFRKSMAKLNAKVRKEEASKLTVAHAILDRYPRDDSNIPVEPEWCTFAFPEGLKASATKEPPRLFYCKQ